MGTYKVGDTVRAIDVHETGLSYGTVYTVEQVETRQYGTDLLRVGLDWYSERRFEPSQRWLNQAKQGEPKSRPESGDVIYVKDLKEVISPLFAADQGYTNNVTHPAHYTKGSIEVYDFIKAWDMSFPQGNVVKYVTRAPYKGRELEDLKKARWYLDQLITAAEDKA